MTGREGRTFRLDLARAVPLGTLETLPSTFAVLIAVRHFGFPDWTKAMLVGAASAGLMASLAAVPVVRWLGLSAARACSLLWTAGALVLGSVAVLPHHPSVFVACVMTAGFLFPLAVPLLAQIYRSNYRDRARGRLFAWASFLRMATAMGAGLALGRWLEPDIGRYPMLFLLYAAAAAVVAACLWPMESVPPGGGPPRLLGAFRHARRDKDFRKLLGVWMFLGFGNLMGVALFVEHAANPAHGHLLSTSTVSLLTTTVPVGCALVSIILWGRYFDRGHFYRVRLLINVFMALGIACYYFGQGLPWLVTGMVLHGLARGGADVSWTLWVTKFAGEREVADYMSVHTFLTGFRGVTAPFLSFLLLRVAPPSLVAALSCLLIVAGSLWILPEAISARHHGGRFEPAPEP